MRTAIAEITDRQRKPPRDDAAPYGEGQSMEYSDDALALRFTEKHGADLRFTAKWGRWSIWDGLVWKPDDTLHVFDLARKICRDAGVECESDRVASAATVAAVERLARADRQHSATVDQWDAHPWLLNTPGGVADLQNGTLCRSRRDNYMTKLTAVAPGGDCPLWMKFLDRITNGDKGYEGFLQRVAGYCLTGVTTEHALFFLYGTGANGKSVFLNTVSQVIGDYAKTAPIETFIASKSEHHPTELAGLQGARIITAVETEEGRQWAESKLKALTGGDPIAARFMRQNFFQYTPQFKLLIAGNHRPGLRTVDEAMRRRFYLLPLSVTIPREERDPELPGKLRDEWGGILQWMIDGCSAWRIEGLNPPAIVQDATRNYLAAEDALARWIDDCCVTGVNKREAGSSLWANWQRWAATNEEPCGSQKRLSEKLEARGFTKARTSASRDFQGISLRRESVTDVTG